MPLSWNEIRHNAIKFSREWKNAASEQGERQTFWNQFFEVFGKQRKHLASFEESKPSMVLYLLASAPTN